MATKNQRSKKYYWTHAEEVKERVRCYRQTHKQEIATQKKKYSKEYNQRPLIRLQKALRRRIKKVIKGNYKSKPTLVLLGCSVSEFKIHIEKQFQSNMSWKNWGRYGWHIDHKIPCAAFDLSKSKQQKQCFHYTNLQPLWAKDNLSKGARW